MKYSATIIFLSLFNLSADASCELSSEDLKLREGFQTIGKTPLWKTFPVGHRFGFKDSRNGDTILILGSNAESESLDLKDKSVLCLDDPPSIRLKIKYHENQGNFIACSKDSEVDDFCPESLRPIQKK